MINLKSKTPINFFLLFKNEKKKFTFKSKNEFAKKFQEKFKDK